MIGFRFFDDLIYVDIGYMSCDIRCVFSTDIQRGCFSLRMIFDMILIFLSGVFFLPSTYMMVMVVFCYTAYFRWCFAAAWAVVEPPLDECWRGGEQLLLVAGVRGDISCRRHPYQHVAGHVGLKALLVRSGDKSSLGLGVDRLRWMVFAG